MTENEHSASASYLGYVFQGYYSLLVLLKSTDDEGEISIETQDDIALEGERKTLYQLKHSLQDEPHDIDEKNVGIWKTFKIWCETNNLENTKFIFVTCAKIHPASKLIYLTYLDPSDNEIDSVYEVLVEEANRVIKKVQDVEEYNLTAPQKKPLPYKTRYPGCQAFINLPREDRIKLLSNILLKPDSSNIENIIEEIDGHFKFFISSTIRKKVVERLIEWWDRRVVLSIIGEISRKIRKVELQRKIEELVAEYRDTTLPDYFESQLPSNEEIELEIITGSIMEKQINLVRGGQSRVNRAVKVRWRARKQREKWMEEDISLAELLNNFDSKLIEYWEDRFSPIKEDVFESSEDIKCNEGKKLLDWSHNDAVLSVPRIKEDWTSAYLVQGSYQQLANDLKLGWHPEWEEKLLNELEEEENAS